jgi:acetyltransferase-like isoleucine patch superfamily enzyme
LKKVFNKLFWGLREAAFVYRSHAALERLQAANPGCTIKSPHIHDACLGENVAILDRAGLSKVCMGNFSYVGYNSRLVNVDMGNFCSIGPHVQIGLARHPSRAFVSTYPAFYSNDNEGCPLNFRSNKTFDDSVLKTTIGNDVWIGSNVIIPGGIRIDTGAIVAAGSVVVSDVPPYAVVGGNPAKVIRLRFSDEQIEMLLASEWWNWPIDKIRRNADEFSDIKRFKAIVD